MTLERFAGVRTFYGEIPDHSRAVRVNCPVCTRKAVDPFTGICAHCDVAIPGSPNLVRQAGKGEQPRPPHGRGRNGGACDPRNDDHFYGQGNGGPITG